MADDQPSFTCPACGATSYNPNDIREGYCGRCHDWTGAASKAANPSASLPPEVGDNKHVSIRHISEDQYFIMVIDDERTLPVSEIPVLLFRNSDDGLAGLKEFRSSGVRLDELWLDHDLGYDKTKPYGWDTIAPVVYYLEELGASGEPFDVGHIFVHTANPAAAPAMLDALRPYYRVTRATFPGS